jgi:hypothetical protein
MIISSRFLLECVSDILDQRITDTNYIVLVLKVIRCSFEDAKQSSDDEIKQLREAYLSLAVYLENDLAAQFARSRHRRLEAVELQQSSALQVIVENELDEKHRKVFEHEMSAGLL